MKKYIAMAIMAASLLAVSCQDFLNKENPNAIESEHFFTNETSLELYANGLIRSYLPDMLDFINIDRYSDTQAWDGELLYNTDRFSVADQTSWSWTQLRTINYYLENMRKAQADEATLNHYEGIGRFFRAMFYIDKLQTYGAVPWYDHVIDPSDHDELYRQRDARSFIAGKILEDLNYACDNCSADAKYRVRSTLVNKYVALAMKARFCLFEGTYRKYHTNDPSTGKAWTSEEKSEGTMYLNECIKACEAIMNSKVYSLIDDASKRQTQYRGMFIDKDGCSVFTKEWIWAVDCDENLGVRNANYSINDYMKNAQHAQYAFNRDFVMTYLKLDGTPFTSDYQGTSYYNLPFAEEMQGRDYRLTQTMKYPGFTRDGGKMHVAPDFTYSKTGYQPIKYLTDYIKDEINDATFSDFPLIRYAEILLDYAEAKAELGQCTAAVWDQTIKPLRERSGVKSIFPTVADPYMVKYFNNTITDPIILEIRRERGVEFAMEGLRYQDDMRWHMGDLLIKTKTGMYIPAIEVDLDLDGDGKADNIVSNKLKEKSGMYVLQIDWDGGNANFSGAGHRLSEGDHGYILGYKKLSDSYTWPEKKYVRPIPTSDVTLNPDLTQNAGW